MIEDAKKLEAKALPALPPAKIEAPNVLSMIHFSNSPFLDFTEFSTNFIPILVLSKASNIEVRDAIRRTWGFDRLYRGNTLRIKIFFLVGTDDFITQRIIMEQNVFEDVIQVSLPDMYTFSPYKELAAMMWVRKYLPHVDYYIKTDDDVIMNIKLLVDEFLPVVEPISKQPLVIGWFGAEHSVQRGSYQKFVDALVPASAGELSYAMSLFYAVTAAGADRMLEALHDIDLIEYPGDPFITGILRDAARVLTTNLAAAADQLKYQLANGACKKALEKEPNLLICTSSLHTGSSKSMPEYFDAWNYLIGEEDIPS